MVEGYLRDGFIIEKVAVEIGLGSLLKLIAVGGLLEQIGFI